MKQFFHHRLARPTGIFRQSGALLLGLLALSSCTGSRMAGAAVGGSLGAIFGSSIGGLMNDPRGADAGRAIGLLAGTAVGVASVEAAENRDHPASPTRPNHSEPASSHEGISYGHITEMQPAPPANRWGYIEVDNVTFSDHNDNHSLDAGERAYLTFNIHNRSDKTLYDVAPIIECDNRRVRISPTAIISVLPSGNGMRYRAAIVADERLRDGQARFTISFGAGRDRVIAKTFTLRTHR